MRPFKKLNKSRKIISATPTHETRLIKKNLHLEIIFNVLIHPDMCHPQRITNHSVLGIASSPIWPPFSELNFKTIKVRTERWIFTIFMDSMVNSVGTSKQMWILTIKNIIPLNNVKIEDNLQFNRLLFDRSRETFHVTELIIF